MSELKFRVWSVRQKTYDYKHPFNTIGNFYINQDGCLFSDYGNASCDKIEFGTTIAGADKKSSLHPRRTLWRGGRMTDSETIEFLKSEIAFLKGKIEIYEKFLKARGYIKEVE